MVCVVPVPRVFGDNIFILFDRGNLRSENMKAVLLSLDFVARISHALELLSCDLSLIST